MTITDDSVRETEEVTASIGDGLRELADFYDRHPELGEPVVTLHVRDWHPKAAIQVLALVDGLPSVNFLDLDKSLYGADMMDGRRQFGPITLKVSVATSLVTTETTELREVTERATVTTDELRRRAARASSPTDDAVALDREF